MKEKKFSNKEKFIFFAICIVITPIIILLSNLFNEKYNDRILNGNYEKAIGEFYKVSQTGVDGSEYLVYKYIVEGKEYKRSVISYNYFKNCMENDCTKLKFWVIYLKDEPNQSLIDLSKEIQDIQHPIFPENLGGFR